MKIAKIFIEKNFQEKETFNRNEISSMLFVRQKEFKTFSKDLFQKTQKEDVYEVKSQFFSEICKWKALHIKHKNNENIENNISKYKELFKQLEANLDSFNDVYKDIIPLLEPLHWNFLPVYDDDMIDAREISPESDIENYYNHFHSLEDLYNVITGSSDSWKTLKGDVNLDKEMEFKVFTERWRNEDTYLVKRTYRGWFVQFLGIRGECTPDGRGFNGEKGTFIKNFKNDSINYPSQFHEYLGLLWELADENEMSLFELQEKLSEIAKLVSENEKSLMNNMPSFA